MRVLITGANGMLGRALRRRLTGKYRLTGLDIVRPQEAGRGPQAFLECDITDRKKTLEAVVSARPDVVVHTAAYTDVDGCEQSAHRAYKVNAEGTETIALACRKCEALICYISTDFIFDGRKETAYLEKDAPNPINIYGQSKLQGERYIRDIVKPFIIVRSSWLFGPGGRNFVNIFLKKAQAEKRIEVVSEQFGSPTYTEDLAEAVERLISPDKGLSGVYHISNSGMCSWYEFALAIKELARLKVDIVPIASGSYPSPTKRPQMSVLGNRRYQQDIGEKLRHWSAALKEYLSNEARALGKD